jgi:hypothetical protein
MSGDKVVFEVWGVKTCGARTSRMKVFPAIEGINDEQERENAFAFRDGSIENGVNAAVFKRGPGMQFEEMY